MANEHGDFWLLVADNYDRVVDLQMGAKTRSMLVFPKISIREACK